MVSEDRKATFEGIVRQTGEGSTPESADHVLHMQQSLPDAPAAVTSSVSQTVVGYPAFIRVVGSQTPHVAPPANVLMHTTGYYSSRIHTNVGSAVLSNINISHNPAAATVPFGNQTQCTGYQAHHLPPPPPLVHAPHVSPSSQPFWVMFVHGRISRCQGCRGQIERGSPPSDLVLQHKQQVLFQNPNDGQWQMSRDLRNTYYHPAMKCVTNSEPHFLPASDLKVSNDIKSRLLDCHCHLLLSEFGVRF